MISAFAQPQGAEAAQQDQQAAEDAAAVVSAEQDDVGDMQQAQQHEVSTTWYNLYLNAREAAYGTDSCVQSHDQHEARSPQA